MMLYTDDEGHIMPEKKTRDMVRVTFYVETKNKARLEKLAAQTDRSEAIMVRRAIAAYLDVEEEALRKRK
jgi:predicted transcriptional regulator